MKKRNTFILSWNKAERHRLGSFTKITALLLFLFPLLVNLSCEKQKEIRPQSKTNSPPVITSATILPENPDRERELSLIIQSKDADGDSISYRYQWIKNDENMLGENKNTLRAETLRKGDIIQVKVTPSDGKEDGKPFLPSPVKVLNSPPVIQEVWIEPKTPSVKDNLKALEKSGDADGDSIYFSYRWEKNGVVLMDEGREALEQGRFKKGDSITVTIIPDDREILGLPKRSDAVTILNSPPAIVSSPPFSAEGTKYLYQVKAADPDNDPITFDLRSGPKGMKIDQKTGLIQWEIQKEDKGTHSIEIEVSDNEGAKSHQRFALVIEVR
jgi:hypothetical protein